MYKSVVYNDNLIYACYITIITLLVTRAHWKTRKTHNIFLGSTSLYGRLEFRFLLKLRLDLFLLLLSINVIVVNNRAWPLKAAAALGNGDGTR